MTTEAVTGISGSSRFSLDFPATLTAIVRSEEGGGFSAEVPALPGCFTEGETLEELRENLREAAEGWLKAHQDLFSADALDDTPRAVDRS
jgi:predicted RNase H-like HicB family nuclease